MVKSVLGVKHQGLQDWVIQRLSAIIMAVYVVVFLGYLVCHPQLSFSQWQALFSSQWMKIITIFFWFSVLYHAWIGMWTVFTDYIKPTVLRACLNLIVLFTLAVSFLWGVVILWSV